MSCPSSSFMSWECRLPASGCQHWTNVWLQLKPSAMLCWWSGVHWLAGMCRQPQARLWSTKSSCSATRRKLAWTEQAHKLAGLGTKLEPQRPVSFEYPEQASFPTFFANVCHLKKVCFVLFFLHSLGKSLGCHLEGPTASLLSIAGVRTLQGGGQGEGNSGIWKPTRSYSLLFVNIFVWSGSIWPASSRFSAEGPSPPLDKLEGLSWDSLAVFSVGTCRRPLDSWSGDTKKDRCPWIPVVLLCFALLSRAVPVAKFDNLLQLKLHHRRPYAAHVNLVLRSTANSFRDFWLSLGGGPLSIDTLGSWHRLSGMWYGVLVHFMQDGPMPESDKIWSDRIG